MDTTEMFINKFRNLEGTTIAEKRRNFFHLVHSHSELHQNPLAVDTLVPKLRVETHLEKVCLIDFLIYFRRYKELSEEFLKGNEIVICKISKQGWFFKKIFEENSSQFVDQFLPTLSYSLRIKILKKLVLIISEEQSDLLFDSLLKRYGVHIAVNVLTACSPQKIEHIIANHPIKLWNSQLKILYNRKPELIYLYFDECYKHDKNLKFLDWNTFMQFIAAKNPEMYCFLQEKYKPKYCKIGKRSTKKVVRAQKNKIIAKPEVYVENLKASRLVRSLGRDFTEVYIKLFPKKIDNIFSPWNDPANFKLLPHYILNHQFSLFQQTFNNFFSNSLNVAWPSIKNDNASSMLDTILDPEERDKWAQLKLQHQKDSQFMKYFTTVNCLNMITPKLKYSPIEKQVEYVEIVTECCLMNKDWNSLLAIAQQLCDSLRSDDQAVHSKFLEILQLKKFTCVFHHLTEGHWKYIKPIVVKAKGVSSIPIVFKYFEFAHKNGGIMETEVVTLLTGCDWTSSLDQLNCETETEKAILLLLIKLAPQILHEGDTIVNTDLRLIMACKNYSKHHSGEIINIFQYPRLEDSLKKGVDHQIGGDLLELAFEWIITTNQSKDYDLFTLFWKNFELLATKRLTFWFLRHKPTFIATHMETFLDTVFAKFSPSYSWYKEIKLIWKVMKSYNHLKMDQMVVDYCIRKLQDDDFENKIFLVEPLSLLMPISQYIAFVETFTPISAKVDLTDEEINTKFQLQRYILKSLVHLTAPQETVPVILSFMRGDYVRLCLSPLYSSLYKTPENDLMTFLERLCKTDAVSVRKHGFYFICITQKEDAVVESLKSCFLSQAIAMAYKHFVKNPSNLSWELLQIKLPHLNNDDHFTAMALVNTPAPKKYKAQYFEVAYEIFRRKKNKFANVLVDKIHEDVVGQLSLKFFDTIDDFFHMKKSEFVCCSYLLYSSEASKFDIIFNGLRIFKQQKWSLQSSEARMKVKRLIETFSTLYMDSEITNSSLVTTFIEQFQKVFTPVETFEEYIILSLIQFKNEGNLNLSRSVIDLHNNLIGNYGKSVFRLFADCLDKIFPKFFRDEICRFQFYCDLLQFAKCTEDVLLVIKLLPKGDLQLKEISTKYYKIIDTLRQHDNEIVQLHLNRLCK